MVTKTIRSTKLATILIKAGCKLENIRPNKNDRTKTVFIFIDCAKFQKLTKEFFKEEVKNKWN
jgi:hypothetical protein